MVFCSTKSLVSKKLKISIFSVLKANLNHFFFTAVYINNNPHPFQDVLQAGMHIPSGSLSQMTEEEHVRIAKRIGLIQHLPVGYYDGTGSRRNHETETKDSSKTTTTTEISNSNTNNQFNLTITEEAVCSEFVFYLLI